MTPTDPPPQPAVSALPAPLQLGRYRLQEALGQGGMGVVYAALDGDLGRRVAIKMLRPNSLDPNARDRLWREARAAASLNHPNITQIYEIGEHEGQPYLVLELLEGESLSTRMERGTLPVADAISIALAVLNALDALHGRGLVHRDIKPSNIFLTPHGPKLLDFGLTRATTDLLQPDGSSPANLTVSGFIVGTPRYMAPEQLLGEEPDARTDLFALGGIVYEMLAGKPAFPGAVPFEVFQAVMNRQPPPLAGSEAIGGVNRIVLKALAKSRTERYASASEMADDLRMVLRAPDAGAATVARPVTRLIVLPFRLLRPDSEVEFLSLGLAEAITTSLASMPSLQLRSTLSAARYANAVPDPATLAAEAGVDLVVSGSLLRSGDEIRVTAQLVEAPSGTVRWSDQWRGSMHDVFSLEEAMTKRLMDSLVLPETERVRHQRGQDVPASPAAYEYFLRSALQGYSSSGWQVSRELLLQAVEADPKYAPAWARLARVYYLQAKYAGEETEANLERARLALERAFSINPDLSAAHSLQISFLVNDGRPTEAMQSLLRRALARPNDAELFGGLVLACRYVGLLDASLAAHEHAQRLDPRITTSVHHTYWMQGNLPRAIRGADADLLFDAEILMQMGREKEAREIVDRYAPGREVGVLQVWSDYIRAFVHKDVEAQRRIVHTFMEGPGWQVYDAEGMFYAGLWLVALGEEDEAMRVLREAAQRGFRCYPVFARHSRLDPLRARTDFAALVAEVESEHCAAATLFRREGGDRLLGLAAGRAAA
jgi:non-specific serine/threonine protein kinase